MSPVDMSLKIEEISIHHIPAYDAEWIGVGASSPEIEHPTFAGGVGRVTFSNGWYVLGSFFEDNMGQGFCNFHAVHIDHPEHPVMGDYGHCGLFCTSRKVLEKFYADFPPYQCD